VCVSHPSASPLAGQAQAILNIEWRDAGGSLISFEFHSAADAATPTDVWRQYVVESQPAPAGTATIHFLLGALQGPTDPTPQVWFDEAVCVSLGPPTLESLQWVDFPGGRVVSFSGRDWRVKGPGYYGPGPNLFDNGGNAVWIDAVGRLHLAIHKIGSSWYSSEVALVEALGYGDYVFTTRGRVDELDANAVLGLFLWEYGPCWDESYLWWNAYNEFDIEFSRWGNPGNAYNAQFVAQPASWGGNVHRFHVALGDTETTSHAMRWMPHAVDGRSWRGGPDEESAGSLIASWTYTGPHIPRPEMPRVHLNLWQLSAPAVAQEVVFEAFTFRSACPTGDCGVVAATSGDGGPARLATAVPNPFRLETAIRFSVAEAGTVELAVFDVAGRRVRALVSGFQGTGEHAARWDGRDDAGRRVAPGVYFCRLRMQEITRSTRVIVLD
jgi:hypothetical protein